MIGSVATDMPRRIAGYGLPRTTPAFPQDVLDDVTWDAMLAAVVRERITGHLVQAIHDDAFPATADQQAASVDAHERALALAVLLERLLLTTIAQLDSVKIQTRVLRGPAVARTVNGFSPFWVSRPCHSPVIWNSDSVVEVSISGSSRSPQAPSTRARSASGRASRAARRIP